MCLSVRRPESLGETDSGRWIDSAFVRSLRWTLSVRSSPLFSEEIIQFFPGLFLFSGLRMKQRRLL